MKENITISSQTEQTLLELPQESLAYLLAQMITFLEDMAQYNEVCAQKIWYIQMARELADKRYLPKDELMNNKRVVEEYILAVYQSLVRAGKLSGDLLRYTQGNLRRLFAAEDLAEIGMIEETDPGIYVLQEQLTEECISYAELIEKMAKREAMATGYLQLKLFWENEIAYLAANCLKPLIFWEHSDFAEAYLADLPGAWAGQSVSIAYLNEHHIGDRTLQPMTEPIERVAELPQQEEDTLTIPLADIVSEMKIAEENEQPAEAIEPQSQEATIVLQQQEADAQDTAEVDADELNELGICYFNGKGVEQSDERAVELFRQAADMGSLEAQYNLAYCCSNGYGIKQSDDAALYWYLLAAKGGYGPAEHQIATFYENGQYLEKDDKQAFYWHRNAAEHGEAESQYKMAEYYTIGELVAADKQKATEYYQKAALGGQPIAQYQYGIRCYLGEHTPKNEAAAAQWYEKSAKQGYAPAQNELGNCYYYGVGVQEDMDEAVKWYRKAAEENHYPPAQCNLGARYYLGEGVREDNTEAIKWFRLADENNDPEAANYLGLCYDNGYGVKKDCQMAVVYYKRAAEGGNADGQNNLAMSYYDGTGVKKDKELAKEYFMQAAKQGNQAAIDNLRKLYRIYL